VLFYTYFVSRMVQTKEPPRSKRMESPGVIQKHWFRFPRHPGGDRD
jgi:hypothetical protein